LIEQCQIARAAEFESLSDLRDFIKAACAEHAHIDEQTCYDMQLAVDEACTNIITHGYAGMNPGTMILAMEIYDEQVRLTITDFGHPFEPCEPPAPDLQAVMDGQEESGFGLFFIYQTMDDIQYQTSEAGNQLVFTKMLVPAPGSQMKENESHAD
jgi:anti-sigma regulatory factor (Ser/Thr protein kinase)